MSQVTLPPNQPQAPAPPRKSLVANVSLAAGLVIFLICGILAFFAGNESFALIRRPLVDPQSTGPVPITTILENAPSARGETVMIYNRVLEAEVYHPALAGKYAIVLCTLALSFGLLALGYGLFVQGVEGTVALQASRQAQGQTDSTMGLAFSTQTPGAFCFLLGAILAIVAVTRSATLQLSPWEIHETGRAGVPASSATAQPTMAPPSVPDSVAEKWKKPTTPTAPKE